MSCPVCQTPDPTPVLRREGVPVHQNRVYRSRAEARAATTGTLDLVHCTACDHTWNRAFDASLLDYGQDYDNRQDLSPAFDAYLDALVARLVAEGVQDRDVVEVGCGQGTFLRRLCAAGGNRGTGFDPAYRGPDTVGPLRFERAFYGPDQAQVPADVVICRHVIEHVPDPLALVLSVRAALVDQPDATVAFECPDLTWIVEHQVLWDVFYEHVNYFSPTSLSHLFRRAGFTEVRCEPAFGGQYQWLTARPGPADDRLPGDLLGPALADWSRDLDRQAQDWRTYLDALGQQGPVVAWGAGAKGMTLAHHLDPQARLLHALVDVNPAKQGAFVPGTGHPVLAPPDLADQGVAHAIVLNPSYLAEITAQAARVAPAVTIHPPEVPCASPLTTTLVS